MMDFLMMTGSFVVAVLVAWVITAVVSLSLMSNAKVMKWLAKFYMKQVEKAVDNFDDLYEDVYKG